MAAPLTPAQDEEAFYDAEIAPVLAELAMKCIDRRIPFLALVQYASRPDGTGDYGETAAYPEMSKGIVAASNARHKADASQYLTGWAMRGGGRG